MMDDNNFEHLTFQNLNCEIHYWYQKGSDNKWVIFLHGAGIDHEMFLEQYKIFDPTYHLIAWDARGHGLSTLKEGQRFCFEDMVSDLKKLYKIYGIDEAVLIGQSMGGNLAQEIAYHYPEYISKLILIDCTNNTGKLTRLEKSMLKCSNFLFHCYPWKQLINQSSEACGTTDYVKEYVKVCFYRIEKETFIDIMMSLTGCLKEDKEFRFRHPVLLLCGEEDKLGNIKKVMQTWAKSDPNCTFHMIEDAGHNSNQDQPEVVNKLIIKFLADDSRSDIPFY
ncbi:alpha/beta fold hydrolase [Anaerocolumna sp. MB42-C2]|uniref:alpha/beta fold hydrolase n=1 Tax=Anaerocolumna sp. MB42-C2 TaxID=3070997 RepID=UPI0027DEBD83|nr:alpha/beta hydrolase [Anaerocolumna sp. MB42-C2]WMJ86644.1 alpha/beta hydrolase [Anaerocolumna sp. MB42-C2]